MANLLSTQRFHEIAAHAKLSAAMLAGALTDLDDTGPGRQSALEYLSFDQPASFGVNECAESLARLNAYMSYQQVPRPIRDEPSASLDDIKGDGLPFEVETWRSAIADWASERVTPDERSEIAKYLVKAVDDQVSDCREDLNKQRVHEAVDELGDVTPSVPDVSAVHALGVNMNPSGP